MNTFLLGALYCALCAWFIVRSSGIHRVVMLMASLAILAAFVLRLLVLSFNASAFRFHHLISISNEAANRALLFMILGTAAFWLGGKLAALRRSDQQLLPRGKLWPWTPTLIAVGLVITGALFIINVTIGTRWVGTPYAFLMRFLPGDLIVFTLMYLAVGHWAALSRRQRFGLAAVFVLSTIGGLIVGSRGALFGLVFAWLSAALLQHEDRKLPVLKTLLLIVAFAPLLVPPLLGFVSEVREWVRGYSPRAFTQIPAERLAASLTLGPFGAFRILSDRLAGFDHLAAVMNHTPSPLVAGYLTAGTLIKAVAADFMIDTIWSPAVPTTGILFAAEYQGLSLLQRSHSGAWTGIGFFFAYFGWMGGLIGLGVLGFLVTATLTKLRTAKAWLQVCAPYFLYSFAFGGFVSGNFDLITSDFLLQAIMTTLWLYAFLWIDRRRSVNAAS